MEKDTIRRKEIKRLLNWQAWGDYAKRDELVETLSLYDYFDEVIGGEGYVPLANSEVGLMECEFRMSVYSHLEDEHESRFYTSEVHNIGIRVMMIHDKYVFKYESVLGSTRGSGSSDRYYFLPLFKGQGVIDILDHNLAGYNYGDIVKKCEAMIKIPNNQDHDTVEHAINWDLWENNFIRHDIANEIYDYIVEQEHEDYLYPLQPAEIWMLENGYVLSSYVSLMDNSTRLYENQEIESLIGVKIDTDLEYVFSYESDSFSHDYELPTEIEDFELIGVRGLPYKRKKDFQKEIKFE